tara:strand:+ start:30 stop:800 length:771 start_codon:yes stop_codon:yes gene_type:complete
MKKDLISIIIPYHKKKKYIQETLNSIAKQTYKNFEIIIIYDDQDKSELKYLKLILKKIIKNNYKLIINKKNLGAGLSRNKAIGFTKGSYIAFCDADDKWRRNKLSYQLTFMKKNNISFSHSSYDIINNSSNNIGEFKVTKIITQDDLMKSCDIGLSSVMISTKLMKKYFFSKLKTKEDYLLWLKIIKNLKQFLGINKKLICWRYLDKSLSSSNLQKISDAFRLYRLHLKYSYLKTLFYVIRLSLNAVKKKLIINLG